MRSIGGVMVLNEDNNQGAKRRAPDDDFQPFFTLVKKRKKTLVEFIEPLPIPPQEEDTPTLSINFSNPPSSNNPLFKSTKPPHINGLVWIEKRFNETFSEGEFKNQELTFDREADGAETMVLIEMDMVTDSKAVISVHKEDESVPTPTLEEWLDYFKSPEAQKELFNKLKEVTLNAADTDSVIPLVNDQGGLDFVIKGADYQRSLSKAEVVGLRDTITGMIQKHLKEKSKITSAVYKHPHDQRVNLGKFIETEIKAARERSNSISHTASRTGMPVEQKLDFNEMINDKRFKIDGEFALLIKRDENNEIGYYKARYNEGEKEPEEILLLDDDEVEEIKPLMKVIHDGDPHKEILSIISRANRGKLANKVSDEVKTYSDNQQITKKDTPSTKPHG